tara:strand:- start:856 stop:1659 length:804 start_codon:yes stop_codon:yes gene_type:complete
MQKKTAAKPLVSIIINCHNGEKYLNESLNSVFNQTYKNFEVIFFNNYSNDNSEKILKKFSDKRIKYFKSKKLYNLYNARNLAINKAKGKYITFIDVDDIWNKNKLEKQIDFLNKNKQFKIVYSNYSSLKKNKKNLIYKKNLPSGNITQQLLSEYCIGILTIMMCRDIFTKNRFNNKYNIIGDFDLFVKLSKLYKIGSIQKPLALYRIHEENLSKKKNYLYIMELNDWFRNNKKEYQNQKFDLKQFRNFLIKKKIKYYLNKLLFKKLN